MSDLVERLRRLSPQQDPLTCEVLEQAADEIERLRANAEYEQTLGRKVDALEAENHRLGAALERLADWDDIETARQIAAAALEQKQ